MSGSGGGTGGSSYDYELTCDELRFDAQLTSPKPAVVEALEVGDVLDITVATMKGQVVVQVAKSNEIVGGLAGPDATRLRNCIDQGHGYKATVRAVNGGQVRVFVERD